MNTKKLVTIICTAYNHEKYISDAIDGFLMQKTNFDYEVLVHDDASTDRTAEIIRKYAEEYPQIIIPILQEKNQVSQGVQIYKEYLYPRGKGKYFAICEGDDYWTDETKLQKQIDFLETHQDYSMCCHNSTRLYSNTGKLVVENPVKKEGDVTSYEIILDPYGTWIATASIVFRRELAFNVPTFFSKLPVGDLQLRLHCFTKGRVYYFEKSMRIGKLFPVIIAQYCTFLTIGLWHGAEFKYIAYGLYNGTVIILGLLCEPLLKGAIKKLRINEESKAWKLFQIIRTFLIVVCGRIFPKAASFGVAISMFFSMFRLNHGTPFSETIMSLGLTGTDFLIILACCCTWFIVSFIQERDMRANGGDGNTGFRQFLGRRPLPIRWAILLVGLALILSLGVYGPGYDAAAFIYRGF